MRTMELLQNLVGQTIANLEMQAILYDDGSEGGYLMLDTDAVVLGLFEGTDLRFSINTDVPGLVVEAETKFIAPEEEGISTQSVSLTWLIFGKSYDNLVITGVHVYYWPGEEIEVQAVLLALRDGSELIIRKDPFQAVQVSLQTDFKGWVDWYTNVPAGPLSVMTFASPTAAA